MFKIEIFHPLYKFAVAFVHFGTVKCNIVFSIPGISILPAFSLSSEMKDASQEIRITCSPVSVESAFKYRKLHYPCEEDSKQCVIPNPNPEHLALKLFH